jgi:hypothetical protein
MVTIVSLVNRQREDVPVADVSRFGATRKCEVKWIGSFFDVHSHSCLNVISRHYRTLYSGTIARTAT